MSFEIWLAFVGTLLAVMVTPGPGHFLMMSNAMRNGFGRAAFTAFGDVSANMVQMALASAGIAILLSLSQNVLSVIQWLGVAYLVWVGYARWRKAPQTAQKQYAGQRDSALKLYLQGMGTAAVNPRAIAFFATLFPQFLSLDLPFWPQFLTLMVTFVAIDLTFLSFYGLTAHWFSQRLQGDARVRLERIGAALLVVAALLLGLKALAIG